MPCCLELTRTSPPFTLRPAPSSRHPFLTLSVSIFTCVQLADQGPRLANLAQVESELVAAQAELALASQERETLVRREKERKEGVVWEGKQGKGERDGGKGRGAS